MSTLERWSSEKQSAWIYRALAACDADPARTGMFRALADAAEEQAAILLGDLRKEGAPEPAFSPSARARLAVALTRRLGPRRTQPLLAALKVRGLSVYNVPTAVGHPMPVTMQDLGESHRHGGRGGNLRAVVFGVNDGLVSNASLVLGVAGATESPKVILATGVAGLLAGAFSMAAGEYVSVRSQRELYEHQIGEERAELERYPEEEAEELALIYNARGVPIEEARAMTRRILLDKEAALKTLAREELGLNPDDLGSPWGAAIASFSAFALGALVPLAPLGLDPSRLHLGATAALSALALFLVGAASSLFSGRPAWLGGARMLAIGGAAGAATFAIGRLLGVTL